MSKILGNITWEFLQIISSFTYKFLFNNYNPFKMNGIGKLNLNSRCDVCSLRLETRSNFWAGRIR
jgi:hypothetical protein